MRSSCSDPLSQYDTRGDKEKRLSRYKQQTALKADSAQTAGGWCAAFENEQSFVLHDHCIPLRHGSSASDLNKAGSRCLAS
jgi:hypothetical protein